MRAVFRSTLLVLGLAAGTPAPAQTVMPTTAPAPGGDASATGSPPGPWEHLRVARHAEAAAVARARLEAAGDDADAWHALGDALAARGRDAGALAAYERALAAGSTRPLTVRVAAAAVQWQAGDRESALAAWRDVMARWREGLLEGATADHRELIAVADAARALSFEDPSLRRTALRIYEEAMARAPADPLPRIRLADLLLASYNNEEAHPLFEEALSLDPDHPLALLGIARSLHFDHSDNARDAVRAALARAPGLVPARLFLARLLLEDDAPDAARAEVEAALAVNPRSVPGLSMLAALHDRDGEADTAVSLMTLVQTIAPGNPEGYVILAEAAADRRRYADAVRYASRAVALDANHWRAHGLLGMNRLRLGDLSAARLSLERAFRGDPFNVWTKNTLDLLDAMDGYVEIERGRFLLSARADHANVLAPYLFPVAEAAFDAHVETYGEAPPVPVRIEVHPEHDDLSVRTLGLVGVDLLGVSFGPTVVLDAPMTNPGGPANWASVLWHELAHTFQLALSAGRAPRWLAEGMAVHDEHRAREGWGQDVGPGFLQAYVEGKLAPSSRLNSRFLSPQGPQDLGHAYLQSGLLVAWIHRDHGPEALRELLRGFGRGERSADLVREVLGLDDAGLDAAFDAYMQERFGEALAALTTEGEAPSVYASLLRAGLGALDEGDTDAAGTALTRARALIPGHTGEGGPHRALVRLHEARRDPPAVMAAWQALLAVDADDLEAHLALATALEAAGDGAGAARILERALLVSPFDVALHERLAVLLEGAEDWAAARREREAVVALGAPDPVEARYRLALAASRSGALDVARSEVLRALEGAPLFEPGLELLLDVRDRLAAAAGKETR